MLRRRDLGMGRCLVDRGRVDPLVEREVTPRESQPEPEEQDQELKRELVQAREPRAIDGLRW